MTEVRPTFRDAYLVDGIAGYLGAVRRDGHIWTALLFGVPAEQQPKYGFATREEAGQHLHELAAQNPSQ